MSTRCQIGFYRGKEDKIKDWQALIYRHSDGYPEGVLPDIEPFLRWFNSVRGISDTEYCAARLLQWLCNQYDGRDKEMSAKMNFKISNDDYTGTLGHGICKEFHGDIEYYYKISPQAIEVFEVTYRTEPFGMKKPEQWKLIQTIELKGDVNA